MLQISLRTRIAKGLRFLTYRRFRLRSYIPYTSRCSRSRRQHFPHLGAHLLRLSTELDKRVPHSQMLTVNITRSTKSRCFHAIKCDYIFLTILTIHEYHSSSSRGTTTYSLGNCLSSVAGFHFHFPSRFTRQYSFAMYKWCIHNYIKSLS